MVIKVSEIPEEGVQIEGVSAFPEPFQDRSWRLEDVDLAVSKDGDTVFVDGRLDARMPQVCSRCLEPYEARVEADVHTRFVPSPGRGEERELGADDLESDVYDHDQIDLGALLETEAALGLPMKPLCREECKGLCPSCGVNRNTVACACAPATGDPRWAALKTLADRLHR